MSRTVEQRAILAAASEIKRAERKQAVKARPAKIQPVAAGQRKPREVDNAYLQWLRRLPCVACEIERIASGAPIGDMLFERIAGGVEAAHQRHCEAAGATLGKRVSDRFSCPLCVIHHRTGPGCCDPAQSRFWSRLGISVRDYCAALYACFQANGDGAAVVRDFAKSRVGSV